MEKDWSQFKIKLANKLRNSDSLSSKSVGIQPGSFVEGELSHRYQITRQTNYNSVEQTTRRQHLLEETKRSVSPALSTSRQAQVLRQVLNEKDHHSNSAKYAEVEESKKLPQPIKLLQLHSILESPTESQV